MHPNYDFIINLQVNQWSSKTFRRILLKLPTKITDERSRSDRKLCEEVSRKPKGLNFQKNYKFALSHQKLTTSFMACVGAIDSTKLLSGVYKSG